MKHKNLLRTITLNEGKYAIEYNESTGELLVRRHGEIWRNHTGDRFMLAVFEKLAQDEDEAYDRGYSDGHDAGYEDCILFNKGYK